MTSNRPPQYRSAIVGCGKIADGHIQQIRATGRATVVAVCDREPLMARQLGDRFSIERQYADLEHMLADTQPDVLHVATPPESHLAIARVALHAGCNLFMEKPFALTAPETREILELAAAAARRVSVNYLYNFEWPALEMQRLIEAGIVGDVVHLDTAYGYNLGGDFGSAVLGDTSHWVHRLPGKLFHNVLDHVLAKLTPHIAEDADLSALSYRRRPAVGNSVADALHDELRFTLRGGSVTAMGMVSAHGRPVAHLLRVVGTRNMLEVDYALRTLVLAASQDQPSAIGRLIPPWKQAFRYLRNARRNLTLFRRYEFGYFHPLGVLLHRFYDAMEGICADPIPPAEILRVSVLIDRLVAATRQPAVVP